MTTITDNLNLIRQTIPEHVKLVAVSKFHPIEAIQEVYDAGQRVFGESRMQELDAKHGNLPDNIEWHFIGHLQRNKVSAVLPYTSIIESVDSVRLYNEIVKQAEATQKRIGCLLQIHIAEEHTKYGFTFDECKKLLESSNWKNNKYAYFAGIMGMATNTDDKNQVRAEFRTLKNFFAELKCDYFKDISTFKEISMGMSGDYKIAIEEGATIVRIGSSIFGQREY